MADAPKGPSRIDQAAGAKAGQAARFATRAAMVASGVGAVIAEPASRVIGGVTSFFTTQIARHKGKIALGLGVAGAAVIGGVGIVPALMAGGTVATIGMIITAFGGAIVGGAIAAIMIGGTFFALFTVFVIYIINTGGYVVPIGPPIGSTTTASTSPFSPVSQVQSEYIEVLKKPDKAGPFQNGDLPLSIKYTITVRAKKGALTDIKFGNSCTATKRRVTAGVGNADDTVTSPCPQPIPDNTPTEISAGQTFSWEYQAEYGGDYRDAFVVDTFSVTATSAGVRSTANSTAVIKIGNPPDTCPSGWAVATGNGQRYTINQGPGGTATHGLPKYAYQEAVDIHPSPGSKVIPTIHIALATHTGIVSRYSGGDKNTPGPGPFGVSVKGTCLGKEFRTSYAHMQAAFVRDGQAVGPGTPLGIVGDMGFARAAHLHYEFREGNWAIKNRSKSPPFFIPPFYPVVVPVGCTIGTPSPCNITIQ